MPRRPRIRAAGFPFHLIQRGNNRVDCFRDDADRRRYLEDLAGNAVRFGVAIHAYVLMSNHVHLLATPPRDEALSQCMKFLGQTYVRYFNRRHGRTGTLWEGRFRSSLVDTESYLLTCHRYIECNPVRAGMVRHPRDYAWSSHRANAEGEPNPLIQAHGVIDALGATAADRQHEYRELFREELSASQLRHIRAMSNGGFALGTDQFVKEMSRQLGRRLAPSRRVPAPRDSGLSPIPVSGLSPNALRPAAA